MTAMAMPRMQVPRVLESEEGQWVVLGLIAIVVVYYVGKQVLQGATQAAGAAASAVGGAVTGNNAVTQGTEYQGTGILGTLGAATDAAAGGGLSSIGDAIGGWLSDLAHPYDPNAPTQTAVNRDQVVTPNYVTDLGQTTDLGVTDPSAGW